VDAVTEDQRQRILRDWHEDGGYLLRLWEALETAREAAGRLVEVVERA
jgi:hypothetical protein